MKILLPHRTQESCRYFYFELRWVKKNANFIINLIKYPVAGNWDNFNLIFFVWLDRFFTVNKIKRNETERKLIVNNNKKWILSKFVFENEFSFNLERPSANLWLITKLNQELKRWTSFEWIYKSFPSHSKPPFFFKYLQNCELKS